MGVLDDWLTDAAAPPWGRIAATFIGGVQAVQNGKLLDQLTQWGSHLVRNATARWGTAALRPVFCAHPGCREQALVPCAACQGMHCLAHVLVSFHAEGICERCAADLVRARAQQRAQAAQSAAREAARGTEQVKEALRTLRLTKDATWDEIRSAYKKLAVRYNADKPMTPSKRKENEEKLKKINAAYALLRELHEKEAA